MQISVGGHLGKKEPISRNRTPAADEILFHALMFSPRNAGSFVALKGDVSRTESTEITEAEEVLVVWPLAGVQQDPGW